LMAPRVDRTIARVSPPGGARRRRSARIEVGDRYATWKEHRTHSISSDVRNFLSLFKGQGAAVRGDDRVVNVRHGKPPRRAISSAG
jgi:hypothetical protein